MPGCYDLRFWIQKTIPLVYDESLSYLQMLRKLCQTISELALSLEGFQDKIDELAIRQDQVEEAFAGLQETVDREIQNMYDILEKIKNGEYLDLYLESIKAYIDKNLQIFVANLVKYVSFGISDDGYFVADIPDTWEFLEFETVPWDQPLAGHLVLRW